MKRTCKGGLRQHGTCHWLSAELYWRSRRERLSYRPLHFSIAAKMYGRVSRIMRAFPESSGYSIEMAEFALRSSATKTTCFLFRWAIQHVIEPYDDSHMMKMTQRKTRLFLSLGTYISCEPDSSILATTNRDTRTKNTIVHIFNYRISPLPLVLRCMPHVQEIEKRNNCIC